MVGAMTRFRAVLIVLGLLALAVPAASTSADRMLVGFQDDPSFRWLDSRDTNLTDAAQTGASIVRTTVYWDRIAPTRPAAATDPFDAAYRFDDLDDLVRSATLRGMTVMMSVWSTPRWANGGKGPNYAPTRLSDYQSFMRALAARYSGRYPGYPFVGYFSVWNEPNLQQFLAPTYDSRGKPKSPLVYAGLARAGYAGVKAGNPRALVGIGETSPRGRSKPTTQHGVQQTLAPALFAKALSAARPLVKFDAWAHHPYSDIGASPTQKVRYPNVNLVQIPTFDRDLDKWFKRKVTAIWITEYGFQTKPGQPKGVTPATAGRLREAGVRDRQEVPARDDVHLVHLPRRAGEPLAQRAARRERGPEARLRGVHRRREAVRRPQPAPDGQGGGVEPDGPGARMGAVRPRRVGGERRRHDLGDVSRQGRRRQPAGGLDRRRRLRGLQGPDHEGEAERCLPGVHEDR